MLNQNLNHKFILGIGGMNMDINVKSIKNLKIHDSNPSHVSYSMGGVVRNIIENLTRLEENTVILSSVGCDEFGNILLNESSKIGINTDYVYRNKDYQTSCYIAVIDGTDGDMFIGASDMDILEHTPFTYYQKNIDIINQANIVVMDTNLPVDLLAQVFGLLKNKKVFVDPVSANKCEKIKPYLKNIYMIKPNLIELECLSGIEYQDNIDEYLLKACEVLHQEGVYEVVVSLGSEGCYYSNQDGIHFKKKFKPCQMENATGAGDSFIAGYIKGYVNDLSIEERIDYALACGLITVKSMDTISKDMNMNNVINTIKNYKL